MRTDDQQQPPPGSTEPDDNARRRLEQDLMSRFGSAMPVADEAQPPEAERTDAGPAPEHRERD
jgi:hypothetical protein